MTSPCAERKEIITESIAEARKHTAYRNSRNKVEAQNLKSRKTTSSDIMKLFKMGSAKAEKLGTARLQYEDMVRRAERKMSERQRMAVVSTQTAEEKAADIAEELFHIPGSMLTSQEIAHMWQESGCEEALVTADCTIPTVFQFRTPDGTCNNLERPTDGAARTSFRRLIPGQYEDGVSTLRGGLQNRFFDFLPATPFTPPNPSARLISSSVIIDKVQEEDPFTHILMQWGQFLDHDLDLAPELEAECEHCEFTDICEPVRVLPTDPAFGNDTQNEGDCLPFRRSLPTCDTSLPGSFAPREQINDITSFIDGSMVYGSSEELSNALREFRGGRLLVGPNFPANQPSLPVINEETREFIACPNRDDCFLCGDARCNEQISLTIMHTIWVREHNRCTRQLARVNPQFDDERLYQECRRIVGALIQKITYTDYLPKVLGPANFEKFIGPYVDYDPNVDPSIPNSFATAAYRYGHSLIRPKFDRLDANRNMLPIGPLNLVNAFFNPPQFRISLGSDPITRGLVNTNALRMDEFMNAVLTTQLFQTPASPGYDLAAFNIQRGRDHGLPPYLIWRNFCARIFGETSSFENLMTKLQFMRIYGSLDTVDLFIGGLAEDRLPGSLIGATFACIFGLTFANVRNGDSFYYERPGQFTPRQLRAIQRSSLSRVLCDNLDDLREIQPDAFLSNQTRVDCSQIPGINFRVFREEPCFVRVGMAPRNFEAVVDSLVRVDTLRFLFSTSTFPPSLTQQFQCQTIQCPTASNPATVISFSNFDRISSTTVASNSALPSSRSSRFYQALWDRPTVDAGQGGVFTSREACEASTATALDVSFGQAAEKQQESRKEDHIPREILDILHDLKKDTGIVAAIKAEMAAAKLEEEDAKMSSDEALMQELDKALKSLH